MKMTKDIYGKMAKQASPPSTFVKNSVMAFYLEALFAPLDKVF